MLIKIKDFFTIGNEQLKKVSLIVLLSYVFLVTLPFISTPIPFLWNIVSNGGAITVIYRAIISTSFFFFFLLAIIFNKLKPNIVYLSFSFLMLLSTIIGFFVLPNSVIYGDGTIYNDGFFSNNSFFHFSYYGVGLLTYLKSSSRLLFGLCFGYVLLYVIPEILDKKTILYISLFYFALSVFSCLFSMIFEAKVLITNLKTFDLGGGIKSLYSNKNDFGSFLIIGCLSYLYIYFNKIKHYRLFFIPFALIIVFGIICGCKTSLLFSLVFIVFFTHLLVKKASLKHKYLYISLLASIAAIVVFIIVMIFVISYSEAPNFVSIRTKIGEFMYYNVEYTLVTRFQIWSLSFINTNFFKVLFGQTWGYGPAHLEAMTSYYIGTGFDSYHNSFVFIYSVNGLVGLAFYFFLLFKNVKNSFYRKSYTFKIFVGLCLSALILFSLVEDDLIFISGSGFSMFYSIILSPIGKESEKKPSLCYYEVAI